MLKTIGVVAAALAACVMAQAQTPAISGVANFVTSVQGPIAPGEVVTLSGANLGDPTQVNCAVNGGYPATCSGVSVTIGGKTAPIRFQSANQTAVQVPVDLTGTSAAIQLTRVVGGQNLQSAPFTANVQPTSPGLNTTTFQGQGIGSFSDLNNVAITPANPALPGTTIKISGTGFGITNPLVPTGTVPPQNQPLPTVVAVVKVTVGGKDAVVTASTLTSNSGSFNQVVFTVPAGLSGGLSLTTVNVGGVNTPSVNLPVGSVGPSVTSVVNSASNAVTGLPNAGVAPGSIIVAYGSKLGPDTLVTAPGYPWPANLNGTSAQVTVGGKSTNLLFYYTSANQIAGLLPSTTPAGAGTITVTYNGVAGTPAPITVLANNFGVYTVSQNGSGAGIVTFPDYSLVTQSKAANPGETLIIWGTGLGAVTGDEAAGPLPGDMTSLPVQVLVGGLPAKVVYRGRSGCCVGEDQIAFEVPAVSGCFVPLAIQINNQVSNYSAMAVAPTGRACVPSVNVLPPSLGTIPTPRMLLAQMRRDSNPPPQFPNDQPSSDSVTIIPYKLGYTGAELNAAFDGPSLGSCYAVATLPKDPSPPILAILDAGTTLSLKNPGGTTRTIPKSGTQYALKVGDTTANNFFDLGSYTLAGTGGADISAFTAAFSLGAFSWTNKPANNGIVQVNRSQGLTVTWSGGDPAGYVQIQGFSGTPTVSMSFACNVATSKGTFTVPPSLLLAMPGNTGGSISLINFPQPTPFTAPGVDIGAVSYEQHISSLASFQ